MLGALQLRVEHGSDISEEQLKYVWGFWKLFTLSLWMFNAKVWKWHQAWHLQLQKIMKMHNVQLQLGKSKMELITTPSTLVIPLPKLVLGKNGKKFRHFQIWTKWVCARPRKAVGNRFIEDSKSIASGEWYDNSAMWIFGATQDLLPSFSI
jgi:hypothetical protein